MIKIENGCVDCGLPCLGDMCPNRRIKMCYCDNCGGDAAYQINGKDYCVSCARQVSNNNLEQFLEDGVYDGEDE